MRLHYMVSQFYQSIVLFYLNDVNLPDIVIIQFDNYFIILFPIITKNIN